MKRVYTIGAAALIALAGQAFGQVQHGSVDVVENDGGNLSTSITMTRVGGDGPWSVITVDPNFPTVTSSRGDYFLNFGFTNDLASGLLIPSVHEGPRQEPSKLDYQGSMYNYFSTPSIERNTTSNRYFVALHEAPTDNEVNNDFSFAFFPFADVWMSGLLKNTLTTGGVNNNGPLNVLFSGTSWTLLPSTAFDVTGVGNEILDPNNNPDNSVSNGFTLVSAQGTNFSRDGVMLVVGAKNEDNRASVHVRNDGVAVINCIDNGSESGGENDPVAFVFIPENTPGVVMGQITGSGRTLFKQGSFSVEPFGAPTTAGRYKITITGESPSTGTMIACPYTELSGTTVDNPVWVVPDTDGWIIETRDTEPLPTAAAPTNTGMTLQDLGNQMAIQFAFFKNGVDIRPGTPSKSYRDFLDKPAAARFTTVEFTPNNGTGDSRTDRAMGNAALDIFGDNRGDVGISWLNARHPSVQDNVQDTQLGMFLTSTMGFLRDNSATGGISGWATMSFDNGEARLHAAGPAGGEINANFAAALFPTALNLTMVADVTSAIGSGTGVQPITGNPLTDGVFIALNWNNTNIVATATPNTETSAYDITFYNAGEASQAPLNIPVGGVASSSVDNPQTVEVEPTVGAMQFGGIYFPYITPGLIAGQIAADGTIQSSTNNFTIGSTTDTLGFEVTTITIPGVNASTDGILLLVGTSGATSMAWEPGQNGEFEVAGLDLTTLTPGRAAFMFVYVPYSDFGVAVNPTNGRCCVGARCAIVTSEAACTGLDDGAAGTVFSAGAASCNDASSITPCCFADFNKAGGITVQDIFDFLASWFAGSVNANVAGDGTVTPTVQDIFDFLAAWFAGGCA